MPTPESHVQLCLHADDTALTAKRFHPTLLFSYLETYTGHDHWLWDCNIAASVADLGAKIPKIIRRPRPTPFFGKPVQ
jgi:hypothetical protein